VNELGEWIELGELCICILKKKNIVRVALCVVGGPYSLYT